MIKVEENEDYSMFEKPLRPGIKVKVCTLKVSETGKKIGSSFMRIIDRDALNANAKEIYVTTFEKQEALISLLKYNGFRLYTHINTTMGNGKIEKEDVFVKQIKIEK